MGFFRTPDRPYQRPQKRSRLPLLLFLFIVYGFVKLLGSPAPAIFRHAYPHRTLASPPPIVAVAGTDDESPPQSENYHFAGFRVRENGTDLNLGDRRTKLPASLLIRFFPDALIIPSCLTQPPPQMPALNLPPQKPRPIREDWPGFYGAPWTARSSGNLIALLHVYAPRNAALPVSPPQFQIYSGYDGQQTTPTFITWAPATFVRGSKAVLYRVFLNGPVRCLDLVVQNGENIGIGHLYYQKYHHYYETDAIFQIQP